MRPIVHNTILLVGRWRVQAVRQPRRRGMTITCGTVTCTPPRHPLPLRPTRPPPRPRCTSITTRPPVTITQILEVCQLCLSCNYIMMIFNKIGNHYNDLITTQTLQWDLSRSQNDIRIDKIIFITRTKLILPFSNLILCQSRS